MSGYSEIAANDLFNMMENQPLLLVDVRNDDEVARGIIPNAIHIPLAMLPAQFELFSNKETLVFYCHSGIRSAHAAAFAASMGCKNVLNLSGGILAWGKAGLPFVAKGERNKK
ncbi:MAG: rhodanese-like domain-containing protein [Methylotenera sp.]|nr:rhodanese-like domain-containing protein [Methylotenera sp.]